MPGPPTPASVERLGVGGWERDGELPAGHVYQFNTDTPLDWCRNETFTKFRQNRWFNISDRDNFYQSESYREASVSAPPATQPSLPRRRFGVQIRAARKANNLTQPDIATAMGWSAPTQSRIERGHLGTLCERDVYDLCKVLGITDSEEVAALVGLLQEGSAQPKKWWQQQFREVMNDRFDVYVGLEYEARAIDIFQAEVVPGLFQIPEYAQALNQLYFPHDAEERARSRIDLKMQRQASLTRKTRPMRVSVVLDEAILRRVVGSQRVMAAQFNHLADMSKRDNITIRVLPFTAGYPVGTAVGAYSIMEFDAYPEVVYIESFNGNIYLEDESDVSRFRTASTTVHRAALDVMASRSLLRQASKEFS